MKLCVSGTGRLRQSLTDGALGVYTVVMTITEPSQVLEFEKFSLRRFGPDRRWLIEWKTTGLIEYIDTGGKTNASFVATALADRLEGVIAFMKETA